MYSDNRSVKLVVTGASGFIGRRIVRLLRDKHKVELVPVTRQNIPNWQRVSDYSQASAGDVLIHLAENCDRGQVAGMGESYKEGIQSTLMALLAKGYSRVIYASSAVLYSDNDKRPHLTSDKVVLTDNYSRIKHQSECAVLDTRGGVVVRLANIYGRGMSENNVMSAILRQIPGVDPLQVMDASPIRDFLSADDAADGIVALALGRDQKGSESGLYNLGTGIGTSIGTLANMALEIAGESHRRVEAKSIAGKDSCLILDYNQTTLACGWKPRTTLAEGITDLLQIGKEEHHHEASHDSSIYR
ncbi:NAD(P)-dependent oxidoreductase [Polynucleobacter sp. MWH-HuK1]|uniref:NAD-dependent epimerase/dehydratase family protein n=1 Tax=Polynucleobacter sp. MWH-HuK1 TaxID=1743158 RepID=UPI001C0BFD1B|nr:NAD(P)-dependent oxidoreductase [Polynucleobacter sp. MWH-HuK1]MBU3564442.1 NAD(P)-dependent oxidoreductase [Polynucleobacter sp. MWH-HuK1]